MFGASRLKQWKQYCLPRVIILLYHRVANLLQDPQCIAVTPEHFAEHLEILRKYGSPVPLKRLDGALRYRNFGRSTVVVTFDDGYADNLHNAKPLLERYDVPATVFVATGYMDKQCEFSSDALERVLLQPGTLPGMLCLTVNGNAYQWELGAATRYSEGDFERNRFWKVGDSDIPTERHLIYRSLHKVLRPLLPEERQKAVDGLLAWAGIEFASRPTHRFLSTEEVISLAKGGLVEIGSHTVTHPILAALPTAAQRDEITLSKSRLEEILGEPVNGFAYPYGTRLDYAPETVGVAREAGFTYACSNFEGIVREDSDPWQLPRFLVRDWDGEGLARRLGEWLRD